MISTHKLHHAVVLADQANFRRAAGVLNLTQPALTRSIQSLERELGVQLFERSHRGIVPTPQGRVVVDRARVVLADLIELEHEVALLQGLRSGNLEVSLGPYPAALSGKLAVARFVASHPEISCRVRVAGYSEVADDVAEGRCELGVADLHVAAERGLVTEIVNDRPGCFLARPQHPLIAKRRCSLADVVKYPWATSHLPDDLGRAGHLDPSSGEFVPAFESVVVTDLLVLAHESDILVGATLTMAEEELANRELAVVQFSGPWLHLFYGFITRPNRSLSPATLRFMEIAREIEKDLERREEALRERYLGDTWPA